MLLGQSISLEIDKIVVVGPTVPERDDATTGAVDKIDNSGRILGTDAEGELVVPESGYNGSIEFSMGWEHYGPAEIAISHHVAHKLGIALNEVRVVVGNKTVLD